jgi:hypothetical protein
MTIRRRRRLLHAGANQQRLRRRRSKLVRNGGLQTQLREHRRVLEKIGWRSSRTEVNLKHSTR